MQSRSFLDFGEDFFLPYMGMAAILFSGLEPFEQRQHPFDRRLHVKSGENWLCGFREEDV